MKKKITVSIVALFFFLSPLFLSNVFADQPPDPGGGPGSGDDPVGGGAPIGSGLVMLIGMGTAYGIKKIYKARTVMIHPIN